MPESMTPEYVRRRQNTWGNVTLVDGVNTLWASLPTRDFYISND